jgi:hypothetical protein
MRHTRQALERTGDEVVLSPAATGTLLQVDVTVTIHQVIEIFEFKIYGTLKI